ncbi:uncharacterized protein BX663DRAFT_261474 [Cokeromyces recurvatus]|uniref:uncharacterized protein n=1 Tax=Cokeromyces recurvatus TaxID=90255 RepID=UPI00221EEE42|nr:uncharacterized protein BX663DRAFT_261474 [Cokeromyces recurvatus]KAI7898378.1 hypothetical protein BX663DRAFT_261474 [Cokeromyces recurvatus]
MILTDIAMYPPELADQMTFMTNRDGETMQVVLRMPPEMAQRLDDECISVHLEIRIPSTIERFVMNVKNVEVQLHPSVTHVDHMEIKTSNGELAMKDWTGSILRLATTQGKLKVGRLVAEDSVMLENSNSMIVATDRVEAKREVQIKNVNGHIRASSEIYAHDTIFIESSNQAIQLGNIVADHVSIRTSNGKLFIDSIQAKTQILTQTSNAPISLSILGDKNNKVNVLTSF